MNISSHKQNVQIRLNILLLNDYSNFFINHKTNNKMKQLSIIIACILSGSITLSAQTIAPPEITLGKGEHFYRKQQVTFKSNDIDAQIFYTTDGTTPTTEATEYNEDSPLYIDKSATIQAIAVKDKTVSKPSIVKCYKDNRAIAIVANYNGTLYTMGKEQTGTHIIADTYNKKTVLPPEKFSILGWLFKYDNTIVDLSSGNRLTYNEANIYLKENDKNEKKWGITANNRIRQKDYERVINYVPEYKYFATYTFSVNNFNAYPVDIIKGTSRQNLKPNVYGTICMPYDIVVGDRTGATFYNILGKKKEDTKITLYLEEETGTLKAGVPYIFHNDSENVYMYYLDEVIRSKAVTDFTSHNGLIGNFDDNTPITPGMYIIHENKIKKCGIGCTINQGYAYIDLNKVPLINEETAKAKNTIKLTNDNTTAIDNVKSKEETNPRYHNIRGQQVASPRKGLYIVNGKKIIMK